MVEFLCVYFFYKSVGCTHQAYEMNIDMIQSDVQNIILIDDVTQSSSDTLADEKSLLEISRVWLNK